MAPTEIYTTIYRVIQKYVRNFRTRLRNNQSRHNRKDISSTCKVVQKLGVSLPLLTCSPSAWPSRLLYCRGRTSRRDLWTTLYIYIYTYTYYTLYTHMHTFALILTLTSQASTRESNTHGSMRHITHSANFSYYLHIYKIYLVYSRIHTRSELPYQRRYWLELHNSEAYTDMSQCCGDVYCLTALLI
jgi:hypothetical protein